MTNIIPCLLSSLLLVHAPVPPEAPPDPLARGYLGVTIEEGSLKIAFVEEEGPAFKAGVKAQDVIVRVGRLEPQEFKEVIAHICSFRPGAIIEIEVKRGDEKKVFPVKLATRPLRLDYPGERIPGSSDP
jgi:predicted metalloprotease with PDZ domain